MAASVGKKYFIAAGLIFLAILCYFAEKYVVVYRVSDLAASRLEALRSGLERLDREVNEKNLQGDFFRYLVGREGDTASAADLNFQPDLIESAVLVDRDFKTLVRSGRDLTLAERNLIREKKHKSLLSEQSLLRHYSLTDFEERKISHLVLAIRPDLRNSFATLLTANYDFSVIAAFSRDLFNQEEKKLLSVLLRKQAGARRELSIRGRQYLSIRQTWIDENLILFQISPLPPLYTYLSLYLILLVCGASFVFIIRGHAETRYTRREISERILASHNKAIDARSGMIGELARLADAENGMEEKLIQAEAEHATFETKMRAERNIPEKKTPPIVIEVMPEDRQFRFMNPARRMGEPVPIAKKFSEKEQKLRERAFSDELKGLMAALAGPPATGEQDGGVTEATLLNDIDDFQKKYGYPAIDQYLYYLNELYFDEVGGTELAEAMRVAGDVIQSRDFAILLYDNRGAVFKTGFAHGVPEQMSQSLYLLPKDSVIPNDFADYGYVETGASLKKNPYFSKRFPPGFTANLKGIHIFTLAESFLKARILFFDTSRGGALPDAESVNTVRSYLRQLAPAIQMFFLETEEEHGNPRDLAEWAVQELKECISLSEGDAPFISQYVFETSLQLDAQLNLVREITHQLREGEKILLLSPSRIVAVHAAASGKAIEDIVSMQGSKFIIKESEFGKASRNLYTFIEF